MEGDKTYGELQSGFRLDSKPVQYKGFVHTVLLILDIVTPRCETMTSSISETIAAYSMILSCISIRHLQDKHSV